MSSRVSDSPSGTGFTLRGMAEAETRSDRRRKRDETRGSLLRAALELAEGSPYGELTVERIAGAAGVSRPAFYTHFRDKSDLLLAGLEELGGELDRLGAGLWESDGPPAERVSAAVGALVSFYAENLTLMRAVGEMAAHDEEVGESWRRVVGRLAEATADHIRAEHRVGLIGAAIEAEPTAEALTWMAERCCQVELARGTRTPEELVVQLAPVWTAALYPGVIPADQLRPGTFGSKGPWGMAEPDWPEGTGAKGESSG